MKIQANPWAAQVTQGLFDALGGFWVDVNMHISLHKEFVGSISLSSYFKTIIALIVGDHLE